MKKNPTSQSGLFNPRALLAFALCSVGALLAVLSFAAPTPSGPKEPEIKTDNFGNIYVTAIQGVHGGVAATAGLVARGAVLAETPSVGWRLLHSGTPEARDGATMVYDPALGTNVMFGGFTANGQDSANTWTFDGAAWRRLLTAHSPMARHGASMAYDAAHQVVLLFGGVGNNTNNYLNNRVLNDTWSFNGVDWTQLSPASSPSSRSEASMAFDAARNQILLYGGSADPGGPDAGHKNDTWTWDGTNWTQQQPPVSPVALAVATSIGRWGASLVYNPDTQTVVLFGGAVSNVGLNDTWEWNGITWFPFPSASPPPGRYGAVMDYDAASKTLVLFGGTISTGDFTCLNDTWTWDLINGWKQLSPPNSPSPRGAQPANHGSLSGAYNPTTSRLYINGGHLQLGSDQNTLTDETWSWNGSTWTKLTFNVPPGTIQPALAYDAANDEYVLFGGFANGPIHPGNETWIWKSGSWTQAHPVTSPSGRYQHLLAYDPGSRKLVLFGGTTVSGSCFGDTWTWDGSNWHFEAPSTPPPATVLMTFASDPATGNVVMFGGYDCSARSISNSTWTYTNGQWTKLTPSLSPPARFSATMAYDRLGYLVLFGGGTSTTSYMADTWIWDGATWSPQLTSTFPSQREYASMALDDVTSGHPVLYGGIVDIGSGQTALSDTWLWMESAGWAQQTPTVSPDPRYIPAMAPAGSGSPALLFGGSFRNDLWGFGPPPAVQLVSVVSEFTHGSAGPFDINLPLTGTRGVECRSGGANGNYTVVFTFLNNITICGTAGTAGGMVSSGPNPNQCTVNLTGVSNAQYITVTLTGVVDSTGATGDVSGTMGVLIGDVNATGLVDGNDVSAVQGQARQTANSTNFRLDVNATGLIDGNDVSLVQSKTRTSLPSPP